MYDNETIPKDLIPLTTFSIAKLPISMASVLGEIGYRLHVLIDFGNYSYVPTIDDIDYNRLNKILVDNTCKI